MTNVPGATLEAEARQALGKGPRLQDGHVLKTLEKQLAGAGSGELARGVRHRRTEVDKARANTILGSSERPEPGAMLKLAKRLAEYNEVGLARRILNRARQYVRRTDHPDDYLPIFQKSALYTYKDPDLPRDWQLRKALDILGEAEDLARTGNQETLGLAGAIYKRKWELDASRQDLEQSLSYYLEGYVQGAPEAARADVFEYLRGEPQPRLRADDDQGYCGINAAFVLDLLAQEEESRARRAGLRSRVSDERRAEARLIREEITRSVPPLVEKDETKWVADEWWFYATVGEAYFGLGRYHRDNYARALEWLVDRPRSAGLTRHAGPDAAVLQVPEWQYESTARQLARLAQLDGGTDVGEDDFAKSPPGETLKSFLGGDDKAVRSAFRGRFGLALSGGGFRAALFHIGVLARLAELDVLRHLEVLSCVSGGSIVGASYYLELRHLLETLSDDDIGPADYIRIVERLETSFLQGVQRNIRTRVLAELTTNLRMMFASSYSRTLRVGELYERELYSRVKDGEGREGDGTGTFRVTGPRWLPDWLARRVGFKREKRWLHDLFIRPRLEDGGRHEDFNPRRHNWRRKNKAPVLVLNATSLNTGHCWQFTASYMGEAPSPINRDIDVNYRLRRMYYRHAPEPYRNNVRLGHAVAASSCVPGLFEPLVLDGLYPDGQDRLKDDQLISVRLVDGGVCDNQGVASLLEQDCAVMLVSDGSGQMDEENVPKRGALRVFMRSNGILQARVREAQYLDIASRLRSSLLRGRMFVHLRQGLPGRNVAWKDCPSDLKKSDFEPPDDGESDATPYHIAVSVQRKLAAIRTDLDSFHEAEACALMASGYRMTVAQFEGEGRCGIQGVGPAPCGEWSFLAVDKAMRPGAAGGPHLERLLRVASRVSFKIWSLWLPLIILKWTLASAAIGALAWLIWSQWTARIVPAKVIEDVGAGFTFGWVGKAAVSAVGFALLSRVVQALLGRKYAGRVMQAIRWRDTLQSIAVGLGMSTAGFLVARLHLHVFDRLYLWYGRIRRIPG